MPNVFLIGITQAQVEPLRALLSQQPGVQGTPEFVPSVSARLVSINGAKLSDMKLMGMARRFAYSRSVMWENELPEQTKVLEGAWWKPGTTEPVVSIAEDTSKILNIHPGAWIEMQAAGRTFGARVVAVHRTGGDPGERGEPIALQSEDARRAAGDLLRRRADEASPGGFVKRAAYEKFPTVTVVNVADALDNRPPTKNKPPPPHLKPSPPPKPFTSLRKTKRSSKTMPICTRNTLILSIK